MESATPEQQLAAEALAERDKRLRRIGFPQGISGNPKGRAAIRERADELYRMMAPDFGSLSRVDEVFLKQACLLLARSERVNRMRDVDIGVRMSGEARRLLQSLRRGRDRKRDTDKPDLQTYIRSKYGPASAGAAPAAQKAGQAAKVPSGKGRTSGAPNG